MYLVRVLEGHKPPGCPVERGLPLHGKRRESVGAFPPFICGLEKNVQSKKCFFISDGFIFLWVIVSLCIWIWMGQLQLRRTWQSPAIYFHAELSVMGPIGLLNYTLYKFWVAVNHNEEKQHCFIARKLMCCHWILEILTSVWYNGILYPLYQ